VTRIFRSKPDQISDDQLRELQKCLSDDGVIIAAADTVYGLVGMAFRETVFDRMNRIKGDRRLPYALVFSDILQFTWWYGRLDFYRKRVIAALTPGPVSFVFRTPSNLYNKYRYTDEGVSVRIGSGQVYTRLAKLMDQPFWATSANRSDADAPNMMEQIDPSLIAEVDYVYDTGPTEYETASTVIDLRTYPFKIVREGPWLDKVSRMLDHLDEPIRILVVCTGNICRSPILAAIIQDGLKGYPIIVESAGTQAGFGNPATPDMMLIASEWGLNLIRHKSQPVQALDLSKYDLILTAEPEHRDYLLAMDQTLTDRIELAAGIIGLESIPDPYGYTSDTYREVAETIHEIGQRWIEHIKTSLVTSDETR
jgi:protein-tyrosine phosphatase